MTRKALAAVLSVALAVLAFGTAQAAPFTGELWEVPEAVSQNAILANVPVTSPDVTFDVNSPLNFNATNATVGAWLASGGAFNVLGSPSALSRLMDDFTFGTLVEFTGVVSITNGEVITVTHADGLTWIIGGVDLGFNPGPTAPNVSTEVYGGPSGNLPFTLVYGGCCGGPAVLQQEVSICCSISLPEPASLILLGSGLTGLGGILWRRQRRS